MRKYFYAAIAAVALMVVSCAQKTPAEEALSNYKAVIEKISNFDGNEEEFATLMQEFQKVAQEIQKYESEYSKETIEEIESLSLEAAGAVLGNAFKNANLDESIVDAETAATDIENALKEDLEDALNLGEDF